MQLKLRFLVYCILLLSMGVCYAQVQVMPTASVPSDTFPVKQCKPFFKKDYVRIGFTPSVLFAAGAATWGARGAIRETRNRYLPDFRKHFDDYLQYAPAIGVYTLKLSGVKGRNDLKRTTLSYAASAIIMGVLVNSIKHTAKVERPDGTAHNSFPSGHTANAFMNATFMDKEFGAVRPVYGIGAYGMAILTGAGRSMNNRHWISDIWVGAGIGILSTRLGYFFIDRIYGTEGDYLKGLYRYNPENYPSYLSLKSGYAVLIHDLFSRRGSSTFKSGFELGLEGAGYFNRHWGVGGTLLFSSFPIRTDSWEEEDGGFVELFSQSMGMTSLTVGPQWTTHLSSSWMLSARLEGGIAWGVTGKIGYNYRATDGSSIQINNLSVYRPLNTLHLLTGLSVTRMLKDKIGLTAYADYHFLNPRTILQFGKDVTVEEVEPETVISERELMSYLSTGIKLTAFF